VSRRVVVLGAAVVVLVVAGVVIALDRGGDGDGGVVLLAATAAAPDAPGEGLDPADDATPAPSTPPAPPDGEVEGVEPLDDAVALAGRRVEGNVPLLYAGTRDRHDCDLDGVAEMLTGDDADPALAEAWFAALGADVDEDERTDFVDELTPVRLRFDTRVTGHGYGDGSTTAYPAVLQAGTAVLVDDRGVPRARCAGVTPLSGPEPSDDVTGDAALDVDALARDPEAAWEGFDPAAVVVVAEARVREGFDLADVAGGEAFTRPIGSDGLQDREVATEGGPARPDPCDERDCPRLEITIQNLGGTPASLSWEGIGEPTVETPTSLRWDQAEPRNYRYDVHHEWSVFRVLGPDDPADPLAYDDPAYANEEMVLDVSSPVPGVLEPPRVMECAPGDVTITVTVDGTVAESTTEPVPCTGVERTFTLG
jgi:hypothetical protein